MLIVKMVEFFLKNVSFSYIVCLWCEMHIMENRAAIAAIA